MLVVLIKMGKERERSWTPMSNGRGQRPQRKVVPYEKEWGAPNLRHLSQGEHFSLDLSSLNGWDAKLFNVHTPKVYKSWKMITKDNKDGSKPNFIF